MARGTGLGRLTHYETLGVGRTASADELRRAYLSLARAHHPDRHADDGAAGLADAERRMQAVTAAWAVLGNPARRREYDRSLRGEAPEEPAGFRPFDPTPGPDGRDAPDVPYRPARVSTRARSLSAVVPVLFAASVLLFCVGLVTSAAPAFGGAVLLFVAAGAGFVVLPLIELSRARDDEG